MKRIAFVLLGATLVFAAVAPASAKKPHPDPEPPAAVEISFGFDATAFGLDSTCTPNPLVAIPDVAGNGAVEYLLLEKTEVDDTQIMDIDLDLYGTFGLHLYENGQHSNYGVADLSFIMTIDEAS